MKLSPTTILSALFLVLPTAMSLKAEWIPLPNAQKISPRRSGHTAFSAGPSSPAYVFGGYIEEDDPSKEGTPFRPFHREVRNDLWAFEDGSWKEQTTTGDIPGPRLATATAVVGGNAYLFGGWDPQTREDGGIILETVHKLDLETMEWSYLVDLPDGPASRHVALALPNGNILVHNHRCTDHVWIFDPETKEFTQQDTTGESPGSVGLHTATLFGESTVLVWGGATKDGTMSNRAHVLDLKTWTWSEVKVDNDKDCPSPRAGACLCAYSCTPEEKIACLFGGAETTESGLNPKGDVWALHLTDTSNGRWELLLGDKEEGDSSVPEPRNAATLTQIASGGATKFILTGGWAPFRQTWDDAFLLSISDD